ncbi:MAG TPA: DUF2269 family protein [Thermoanaerobaculia bacterium]|nr:DUF2269 family protein [Thermoanaerobaculia bacterium]
MNPTRWILVVHVLSALWLATGSFAGAVVRAQAKREPGLPGRVAALRVGWRLVSIFGIPGGVFSGLTGLWLLGPLGYGFKPGWVHVSVTLWLLLLGLNLIYLAPRLKKTLAAAEASLTAGEPNDELRRLTAPKHPAILADLSALGIVILVVLMVTRPF